MLIEEFIGIFGSDILSKEFDADMYKGGAYIEVKDNITYIIEVSWECDTIRLVKLTNISDSKLFDLLVEKTDDYYTIGKIYVEQRNESLSDTDKIKNILQNIYNNEVNWILEGNVFSECYSIDNFNKKS